jgi:hypothetical protein
VILQGQDVFKENKAEILKGLKEHKTLEEDTRAQRANKILGSVWIRENQALKILIEKLRDDEKRHNTALDKLTSKPFFRLDPRDFTVIMQSQEFAEERYRKSKELRD